MVDYTMQPIRVQPLDIGHTLGTIAQLEGVQQRNRLLDLQTQEAERKVSDRNRLRAALPGATQGDAAAQAEVASIDPDLWAKIDKNQKDKITRNIDMTGRLLYQVEQAPEQDRPAAYAQARQIAQQNGLDMSKVPETYNPSWVRASLAQATSLADQIKQVEGQRPQVVGRDLVQVRGGKAEVLHSAPEKEAAPSELTKLISERDRLPQGDPRRAVYDAKIAKETKGDGGGPFAGNNMDAQALNIVAAYQQKKAANQPTTQQEDYIYSLAVREIEKPKTLGTPETGFTQVNPPPLPAYPGAAAPAAAPAATAPAPAAPSQGAPPAAPAPAQGQSTVTRLTDAGPARKELTDLKTARGEAAAIVSALEDFRSTRAKSATGERVRSVAGMSTPLNTSYNVAALLAKGDELFKLGVLNGPDLDIIRRTLPDPSTFSGSVANSKDVDAAIDKIVNLIQTKISAKEHQLNLPAAERTNIRTLARDLAGQAGGNTPALPPGFELMN